MNGRTAHIGQLNAELAREALRQVTFPGLSRDIVSFGFVREVAVDGDRAVVRFAPNTKSAEKVALMERSIKTALREAGFGAVEVRREPAFDDAAMMLTPGGQMTPLQAEMHEDGMTPPADPLHALDQAQTQPPDEPEGPPGAAYTGSLPVYQWEIDPADPTAASAETSVLLDDWEFRAWWQLHRGGELVYASLQAIREDRMGEDGRARPHPVGRTEAVNLVYDRRREAILAIYGTVRDFRPFVEAFRRAYPSASEESASPQTGKD